MTADIEQDDLFLRDKKSECYPVTVRKADGMAAVKPAAKGMKFQMRLERVGLQVGNHFGKSGFEVGVFIEKFACVA